MAAPSYTFLMGEYVSFLKAQLASNSIHHSARKFYEERLHELLAIKLEDTPLYQATKEMEVRTMQTLLHKGLY